MGKFEYGSQLPRKLEEVHHETAARTLAEHGIPLPSTSWDDIQKSFLTAATERDPRLGDYLLTAVVYSGETNVGPLFGHEKAYLHESDSTPGCRELEGNPLANGKRGRRIRIDLGDGKGNQDGQADVYLISDTPPCVLSSGEMIVTLAEHPEMREPNDGRLLDIIEQERPNAIQPLDKTAAARIIAALEQDTTTSYR